MRMRRATVAAAVLAALLLLLAGPGVRLGLWTFSAGFTLMRWALTWAWRLRWWRCSSWSRNAHADRNPGRS